MPHCQGCQMYSRIYNNIPLKLTQDNLFGTFPSFTHSPTHSYDDALNLKRLGWGQFDPLVAFRKMCLLERETFVFCDFYYHKSHLSWKFIEIPQIVQKIWRISLSISAIFINFYHFFGFFDISLW